MSARTPEQIRAAKAKLIERRNAVIARYNDGESAAALAREFQVPPTWLTTQLRNWGVTTRDAATSWRMTLAYAQRKKR